MRGCSGRSGGALAVTLIVAACGARTDLGRGFDGGTPAVHDAARPDAALADAGPTDRDGGAPTGDATRARFPWNGWATGSVWSERARRPTFQWEPVDGADRYELRLDDDCTSNETCEFPSPEVFVFETTRATLDRDLDVDVEPPVGRRYHWAVRACRASVCSRWTETRYLDVGRQRADYDGDGYADLVAGAARYERPGGGEQTALFAFRGSADGLEPEPVATIALDRSYAPTNVGDLNADGYADFALASGGPPDFGFRAHIHHGSPAGLRAEPSLVLTAATPECAFAASLVGPGDLDGDGFADLAIGTQQAHSCSGDGERGPFVQIFYARADGLAAGDPLWVDGPFSSFGRLFIPTLGGVGDVDGDGYPDLVVGITDFLDHRPALLYRGGKDGIVGDDEPAPMRPPGELDARFYYPWRIPSVGDVDGDGYADVVTTQRQAYDVDPPGAVFVHLGSASGPPERPSLVLPNELGAGVFGDEATGGDLNGDGLGDLAFTVGSLAEQHVRVHFGDAAGVALEPTRPTPPEGDSRLMLVSSPGDFDGDGAMDLLGAAPYGDGPGAVWVWPGSATGPLEPLALPTPAGRAFGAMLTRSAF